ncbi:hypothetical protein Tco_0556839 [Tanacetum coccineum]
MVISSPCLIDIKNWLCPEQRILLASPKQMALGKDFSNPLIVDSLLKTIWLSMHHVIAMKHWLFQSKRLLNSIMTHQQLCVLDKCLLHGQERTFTSVSRLMSLAADAAIVRLLDESGFTGMRVAARKNKQRVLNHTSAFTSEMAHFCKGSAAVQNMFKSWLTLLRKPSSCQVSEGILDGPLLKTVEAENKIEISESGEVKKV